MIWLAVFIGGGIGSLMRFGTGMLVNRFWAGAFPLATLIANFVACLILGLGIAYIKERIQDSELLYAFLIIGICGGYSTFSTFAKENMDLIEKGQWVIMLLNVLVSVSLCAGVIWMVKK